jgi:hypothetical protein
MKKLLIIPMLFACYMGMCQSSVIGKPIRLQKFEVAQYDFIEEMNWKDAKSACAKLGKGWRLPTENELSVMYKYKDRIGGFANKGYWSSTEKNNDIAWGKFFEFGSEGYDYKDRNYNVRAVRAF